MSNTRLFQTSSKDLLLSVSLSCLLAPIPMCPDSLQRRWHCINHSLTYLLTYLLVCRLVILRRQNGNTAGFQLIDHAAMNRSRLRYWTWMTTRPSFHSVDCVNASPNQRTRSRAVLPCRQLPTQTPAVTLSTSMRYTPPRTSSSWTQDTQPTVAPTSDSCFDNLSTENTKTGYRWRFHLLFVNRRNRILIFSSLLL